VEGGVNPWDTGFLGRIPMDENGYPLELPFSVAGAETTQAVRTVWANTAALKAGTYTVLYDGEGALHCSFDGSVTSESPGRLEVEVTPGRDNILSLEILRSERGNHVRNVRFLLPGTEDTYAQNPWCDEWLEKLAPFKTLRFMDWGLTNNSALVRWEDRARPADRTFTERGVPYEWMIRLCNLRKADAWVCVPHAADDDFIRRMAELFRDSLDADLKIHVEYSNEIWNWMFGQTRYCNERGSQAVPWPERIVPFVQNALDIWSAAFEGQTERLVRVAGVQHAWQDVSNRIVRNLRPGSFDAFAPAAYFGFSDAGYAALESLGGRATAEDVLRWAREGLFANSLPWMRDQSRSLGLPMLWYEGGQHLTPNPFGSDRPYNGALTDAQTHPKMYDLYAEWLDTLEAFSDPARPSLFMTFSFIGPKSGKYGSWGALERQFDNPPPYRDKAPKYQALLDYLAGLSGTERKPGNGTAPGYALGPNYPNPFNSATVLSYTLPAQGRVRVFVLDAAGRRVRVLADGDKPAGAHVAVWDGRDASGAPAASGLYVCRLEAGGQILTRGLTLVK
jgi:hypothetical protein